MKTLKNVLLINAISSGATGLGLLLVPDTIAQLFHRTEAEPFFGVGVFLVLFASLVFLVSQKHLVTAAPLRLIILLDTLWVMGSFALVVFQLFALSPLGYGIVAAVGLWVALMAYLQFKGLQQLVLRKTA